MPARLAIHSRRRLCVLVLLLVVGMVGCRPAAPARPAPPIGAPAAPLIVLSLDGWRWDYHTKAPLPALQTYAWTWAENQVLAAVKLVPLGQSAGQRMLHALHPRLGALAARAGVW